MQDGEVSEVLIKEQKGDSRGRCLRSEKNIDLRPESIGQQEKKVFIKNKQTKNKKQYRLENWGKNIVVPCWFMV